MVNKNAVAGLIAQFSKKIFVNEPMERHVSFKCGGPVDVLFLPHTIEDIKFILNFSRENNCRLYVMGNGTKLLVNDNGLHGIMLKISNNFGGMTADNGKKVIIARAGASVQSLLEFSRVNGLTGLEFMAGIPGTVGGAIFMNAGTSNKWISDCVSKVTVVDRSGQIYQLNKSDCSFEYRYNIFQKEPVIIIEVEFSLLAENPINISDRIRNYLLKRSTLPITKPNAGSIFKNPRNNEAAGALIEKAGLKGIYVNDAQVSTQHANFILNTNQATSLDILNLINIIRSSVKVKYDINLDLELILLGFETVCEVQST